MAGNTSELMFKWRKLGKVFSPQNLAGRPWMREFAQAPATLLLDDRVRVYFSCRAPADEDGQYVSYSTFVDLDRRDLTRVPRCRRKADTVPWRDRRIR